MAGRGLTPTMDRLRRTWLRGSVAATLLPLLGSGLLAPGRVLAAEAQRLAFTAKTVDGALKAYGAAGASESRDISIVAPEIAENGAKVEIEIATSLAGCRSIAIFADKNPFPLCAALELASGVLPFLRIQVKLAESTRLRAVVRTADGKANVAFREIKVTIGGCGG